MTRPKKLIIPCAGLGTRLLPISAVIPKELLPIGQWPAVFYTIQEAFHGGIQRIVLVTSAEKKEFFRQAFRPKEDLVKALKRKNKLDLVEALAQLGIDDRITLVEQYPLAGLGHAVLCARNVVGDEPFCVALPDEHLITHASDLNETESLLKAYERHRKNCISMMPVPKSDVSGYGIAKLGKAIEEKTLFEIESCVEKPTQAKAPSQLAFVGRYLFEPEIWPILEKLRPGAGGEIQLTDAMNHLANNKRLMGHVFSGERIDIGTYSGYYQCVQRYIRP